MENVMKIDFELTGFHQDRDGFFWITTGNGILRYDGFQTRLYAKPAYKIPASHITGVCEDRSGRLWFCSRDGGVAVYDKLTNRFTSYLNEPGNLDSLSSNAMTSLFIDREQRIWAGTENKGISMMISESGIWQNFGFDFKNKRLVRDAAAPEAFIAAITQDIQGYIWVAIFGNGTVRIDPKTLTFDHFSTSAPSPYRIGTNFIFSILGDDADSVWLGGSQEAGLTRFNTATEQLTTFRHDISKPDTISNGNVREIFKDGDTLWLGHFFGGISIIDLTTMKAHRLKKGDLNSSGLRSNEITRIVKDRSGIYWIACLSGEIEKFNPAATAFVTHQNNPKDPESLASNVVMTIFADSDNTIWVGTGNEGLNRFNRTTKTFDRFAYGLAATNTLPSSTITLIFEDSHNNFWVATSDISQAYLCRFNRQTGLSQKIYTFDPADPAHSMARSQRIRTIVQDHFQSHILWIGYETNLLDRFDTKTGRFDHFRIVDPEPSHPSPDIWDMVQDASGKLWISTLGNGLVLFSPQTSEATFFYHDPDQETTVNTDRLRNLFIDTKKRFWVTTENGFAQFFPENGTFNRFYLENTVYQNNAVLGMVEDNEGSLWLPTKGGLARFQPETGLIKIYTKQDGLPSNSFFYKAFCRTKNGELWFGSMSGVTRFSPKTLTTNPHKPRIVLTALRSGNEDIDKNRAAEKIEQITLPWQKNYFEFEYAGLEYTQPHLNQYRYILEGVDDDWVDAGSRRYSRYSGLPGGIYTLRIIGSNNEGVWDSEGVRLTVHVEKPFWKTTKFYTLVIVVIGWVLLMIVFYVNRLLAEIRIRRTTQQALIISRKDVEKTNRFLEAVVRQAPFGIEVLRITDDGWRMMMVNEEACRIKLTPELSKYRTGRSDLHTWVIFEPDNKPFIFEKTSIIQSLRKKEYTHFDELKIRRHDGSLRWISYDISPIVNKQGMVTGGLIVYSDITAKKKVEAKTLEVKNQLDQIFNMMPSILIGINHSGHITHWNRHAADITGLEEQIVLSSRFFNTFPASKSFLKIIRTALQSKRVYHVEKVSARINGQAKIVSLMVYPIGLNETERYVIKIDDITEYAHITELAIRNEKMMMIGGLAAGMAHEINNPLSAIMQGIQNIDRRLTEDLPDNLKAAEKFGINFEQLKHYMADRKIEMFLDAIKNSARRASRIVANMRHFSRTSPASTSTVQLQDVIESSIELAGSEYELKHTYRFLDINIIRQFHDDLPGIICDETQIQQVFINLLKNAAQAFDHDKGPCTITITTDVDGSDIIVEFRDNGPGMSQEQAQRIFEPFYTTKKVTQGTGLGLFVSYMIITSVHKGGMTVSSVPGEGTVFTIRLPI